MFPVVGAIIGVIAAGFDRLACLILHPSVAAVGVLIVVFGLTGGMHVDGLLDSADGLLSRKPPEQALDIMKDSRVGALGVSAGILVIGLKATLIAVLASTARSRALLLAPIAGRYSMLSAMTIFPYARGPRGLGSLLRSNLSTQRLLTPGLFVVGTSMLVAGSRGVVALALSMLVVETLGRFVCRRLGGLTGDVYGALCEVTETVALAVFAARW